MNKSFIFKAASFLWLIYFSNSSYGESSAHYTFTATAINAKDSLVAFEYINKSDKAHCLRADDLELRLVEDSLYVNFMSGDSAKYIGDVERLTSRIRPKKFFILPPGENMIGVIKLRDYYEYKKKDVYVSYRIPVIPCDAALNKSIYIPPISVIKDKLQDPFSVETSVFLEGYHEWVESGFIAVSNKLLLSN